MPARKKYTAFLSFANPDRNLVKALHDLFLEVGEPVYYAPEDLARSGSPQWRDEIFRGINASCAFIPIYTRHSLDRRWVLYESGVADSSKLKRFPARVAHVSHDAIIDLPSPDSLVYDLFDLKSLTALVVNACVNRSKDRRESIYKKIKPILDRSSNASRVIALAKARWVFLAGNVPRGSFQTPDLKAAYDSKEYEKCLRSFVERLTTALLTAGFNVSSCAQVANVGGVAMKTATSWLLANSPKELQRYKMDGTYPIDRDARESDVGPEEKRQMFNYLMDFRRDYLKDKEWLVVIGGSEGTGEEYDAALNISKVQVLPIPCFGGAARRSWDKPDGFERGPCTCVDGLGSCDVSKIVEYMSRPKHRARRRAR